MAEPHPGPPTLCIAHLLCLTVVSVSGNTSSVFTDKQLHFSVSGVFCINSKFPRSVITILHGFENAKLTALSIVWL